MELWIVLLHYFLKKTAIMGSDKVYYSVIFIFREGSNRSKIYIY